MTDASDLPFELILLICEHVVPQHERAYSGNDDLLTASQLNHAWNAAARTMLFRDVTITNSLKDALPAQAGPWQPQPWDTPGIVSLLQGSPGLRVHVKNLRLRLYPFVVQQTLATGDFDSIRERLRINIEDWPAPGPARRHLDIVGIRCSLPPYTQDRQPFVASAYNNLYQSRCLEPDALPWTQHLEPLLSLCLSQLPNLEHIETADAQSSRFLSGHRLMQQWSASYTDALLLRTAPHSIRSVCYRSWPPPPALIDIKPDFYYSPGVHQPGVHQRLEDFVRAGTQITELTIDCEINHRRDHLRRPNSTLSLWRKCLCELRYLTTPTLVRTRYQTLPVAVPRHVPDYVSLGRVFPRYLSRLDPNLDHLLDRALTLQNVKALTLVRWIFPAANFPGKISSSFPALETLCLRGVALWSDHQQDGEELWGECVDALGRGGRVAIIVEEPIVCMKGVGPNQYEAVLMGEEARLALEQRLQ